MLPDLQGSNKKVDRLPVIVTYDGKEQLLGVPKIPSGKGKRKRIADAIYGLLLEWKITDRVQAVSFDTTSTNTGQFQGASLLLEQILERDIFYLPCRHHIYELQLKEVFDAKFSKMSAPGVPMFARFKGQWQKIKDKPCSCGIEDNSVAEKIPIEVQLEIKSFCLSQLKEKQPRDDYKEFLEIILLFLGENIPNYRFRPPGAISHARWMAKGIYCTKIFLFRKYLGLSEEELSGLRDITVFIVILYVKAWFNSTSAIAAPNNDFNFLKAIADYALIDDVVSQRLWKRFSGHLWYLSGEAVSLALFDKNVPYDTKRKMANAIRAFTNDTYKKSEDSEEEDDVDALEEEGDSNLDDCDSSGNQDRPAHIFGFKSVKRITVDSTQIKEELLNNDLSQYITSETAKFFVRFGLSLDFIVTDPEIWEERKDYQQDIEILRKLHVVNDAAERGVKLIEEYNNILCRNEEEKMFLLQVATENRKKYPTHNKNELI